MVNFVQFSIFGWNWSIFGTNNHYYKQKEEYGLVLIFTIVVAAMAAL